jgi:hypothetical protein
METNRSIRGSILLGMWTTSLRKFLKFVWEDRVYAFVGKNSSSSGGCTGGGGGPSLTILFPLYHFGIFTCGRGGISSSYRQESLASRRVHTLLQKGAVELVSPPLTPLSS